MLKHTEKLGLGRRGSLMVKPSSVDALHTYDVLYIICLWYELSKEVGLLCTAELGENTAVDILLDNSWTHCQHLNLDQEGRLCHFPMGLRYGLWYSQLAPPTYTSTQVLKHSGFLGSSWWGHLAKETCWLHRGECLSSSIWSCQAQTGDS